MEAKSSSVSWVILGVFLLGLFPASMAMRPKIDEDTWWHLRVGQSIWENQQFLWNDPFSQHGLETETAWIAYSWLFEILLYGSFRIGDLAGILVFRYLLDLIVVVTWTRFVFQRTDRPVLAMAVLAGMLWAILLLMSERPWHFTIWFTTLTLDALIRIREGEAVRRFAYLPLVYVLWANIHIQFVLGLGLLGMTIGILCWERLRNRSTVSIPAVCGLAIACGLATAVNPYHFHLYRVVWEYASQAAPRELVVELLPPDFSHWMNWTWIILLIVALGLIWRRGFPLWELALLVVALFFSLRMQRDIWFGMLLLAAIVIRHAPKDGATSFVGFGWIPLFSFGLIRLAWFFTPTGQIPLAVVQNEYYPVQAVAWLKEHPQPGPLFNEFNWGGYLIWNLPELPVSMDGRTNLHGEERLRRANRTWAGKEGWDQDPELLRAKVIIAPFTQALTERLKTDPRWQIVFEDQTAVVLIPVKRAP